MNLSFNTNLAIGYTSSSQIARRLTEDWVLKNSYCPSCGSIPLNAFENNRPVADFICNKCEEEFELKSKKGNLTSIITDGSYKSMIDRINSDNNPNFLFLTYSKQWTVNNFLIIPKHFFTSDIIIQRPPLSETARRKGWIGCNINISEIAEAGKVYLVKDTKIIDKEIVKEIVKEIFNKTKFLRSTTKESKGWVLEIIKCIDLIKKETFTLDEIYFFESRLKQKYPNNNFIKDKIRQQLQTLRDKGIIDFIGPGYYKKSIYENT